MRRWLVPLLIGAALLYVGWSFVNEPPLPERTMQAADFTLPTLDGETRSLAEERGNVVIVNFWASWCIPCHDEAPHLQTFYEMHANDVEILAVNVTTKDSRRDAADFVAQYGLTFPILVDEVGDVSTMYGAFSMPVTIIIRRDGTVAHEIRGPLSEDDLKALVQPLIAEKG